MEAVHIGRVAQKTGLSIDAIRFYEKEGLLPHPARTQSGYRLYQPHEIADLEFIRKAQQLGFSLGEIRDLLSIRRDPVEACAQVQDLVTHKLAVVRGKLKELETLEATLTAALRQCRRTRRRFAKRTESCPVLQEITFKAQREKR